MELGNDQRHDDCDYPAADRDSGDSCSWSHQGTGLLRSRRLGGYRPSGGDSFNTSHRERRSWERRRDFSSASIDQSVGCDGRSRGHDLPVAFSTGEAFFGTGEFIADPSVEERWSHILRHCRMAVAESDSGKHAMAAMRGRLMAYSKGMPGGRTLRGELQKVSSVAQVAAISERYLAWMNSGKFWSKTPCWRVQQRVGMRSPIGILGGNDAISRQSGVASSIKVKTRSVCFPLL